MNYFTLKKIWEKQWGENMIKFGHKGKSIFEIDGENEEVIGLEISVWVDGQKMALKNTDELYIICTPMNHIAAYGHMQEREWEWLPGMDAGASIVVLIQTQKSDVLVGRSKAGKELVVILNGGSRQIEAIKDFLEDLVEEITR